MEGGGEYAIAISDLVLLRSVSFGGVGWGGVGLAVATIYKHDYQNTCTLHMSTLPQHYTLHLLIPLLVWSCQCGVIAADEVQASDTRTVACSECHRSCV